MKTSIEIFKEFVFLFCSLCKAKFFQNLFCLIFVQGIVFALCSASFSSAFALEIRKHQNFSKNLAGFLLSGRIEEGDANRVLAVFEQFLDTPNRAAYLASPGGNLIEGIKLGLVFNRLRVKTVIEGKQICASACALAFLGGRDSKGFPWRSSSSDSVLGLHAFSSPKSRDMNSDDTQKIVALILEYGG